MPHNEYTIERDSNFISGFGRATRIVTIHDQGPDTVRGEWHILIDGNNVAADSNHIELNLRETGVNHKKLTNLLKNEADITISTLLDERIAESGHSSVFSYQHHWEIVGESELIELWLTGRHKQGFQQIIDSTQCVPLKSILVDVMKYPPLNL